MVAVPFNSPFTIPVPAPTVATVLLLLLHAPPPVLLSVVALPTQTLDEPAIAVGNGFTVTIVFTWQPVPSL